MANRKGHPWLDIEPYRLSVTDYKTYRRDGFLVVRNLVLSEHVNELRNACEDLMYGRIAVDGVEPVLPGMTVQEMEQRLLRIHMLHRVLEPWERYLLYPRVLDVVQALVGPDVLAMQTMMFIKPPGANGQGFHQDTYYIPTFPDSLIGAWIAVDSADTENGCLRMCTGSNVEPVYPPREGYGYGDSGLRDIERVSNVGGNSNDDDDPLNTLKPIAERYADVETPAIMNPGDVAFFGGHILHRSLRNNSLNRFRRSFVNHYCNARSFTTWDGGNHRHILARGNTHLGFEQPRFGTPCAANDANRASASDTGATPTMMMATPDGSIRETSVHDLPHDH